MRKVWIVVANGSTAKIFKAENVKKLIEIHDFQHIESHMQARELVSDKPGQARGSFPHRAHGSMAGRVTPKEKEKLTFAEQVASYLEDQLKEGSFERLYLIASDEFLGILRNHLNPHVNETIFMEINKDLLLLKPEEIREYLPPVL